MQQFDKTRRHGSEPTSETADLHEHLARREDRTLRPSPERANFMHVRSASGQNARIEHRQARAPVLAENMCDREGRRQMSHSETRKRVAAMIPSLALFPCVVLSFAVTCGIVGARIRASGTTSSLFGVISGGHPLHSWPPGRLVPIKTGGPSSRPTAGIAWRTGRPAASRFNKLFNRSRGRPEVIHGRPRPGEFAQHLDRIPSPDARRPGA